VARALGFVMRRLGQPAVIGELGAGLLLGPSVFGRVAPQAADWLFPGGEVESGLLLALAWLGVALLLVVTGFETDLQMIRRLGGPAAAVSVSSLIAPLFAGFLFGLAMPVGFIGEAGTRLVFALFIAVSVGISALAVSARILSEMDLMRRDIGQVIVGSAMANELVGWLLLGLLSGLALHGTVDLFYTLRTLVLVLAFFAFSLLIGQRLVDVSLRGVLGSDVSGAFTLSVLIALLGAATTQAIGVEAALGAFVAGIVLNRSPYLRYEVRHAFHLITMTVFAPIFFATAGMFVDLSSLFVQDNVLWTGALLGTAVTSKFAGAYFGARLGRSPRSYAITIGVGLNARGTVEIVLATIALATNTFNEASYSAVIVVALLSSMATPPLLRAALRHAAPGPEEAERLEREKTLSASVIANAQRALVPTRGGKNSLLAAQVLDLMLKPEATATVLTVDPPEVPQVRRGEEALRTTAAVFDGRNVKQRRIVAVDAGAAVLRESRLGYDIIAVGMTEGFRDTGELSPTLRTLLSGGDAPVLLVRRGGDIAASTAFQRIVVPAVGTRVGRAAEEVAYTVASRLEADVDVVHIDPRPDRVLGHLRREGTARTGHATVESLLTRSLDRARRFGLPARGHARIGVSPYEGLLKTADEHGADLVVVGSELRSLQDTPFFGHGVEYLLEHAQQTVLAVVFRSHEEGSGDEK
ncbi:MAG: cation:proton antiporter, partial [Actinomycetota bacterium]|nr:cation:proton antiporter [Actinomycetota bacterium]